jgi:hypothetical protein
MKMYGRVATTWPTSHEFWPNLRIEVGSSLPPPSQRTRQGLFDLAGAWSYMAFPVTGHPW